MVGGEREQALDAGGDRGAGGRQVTVDGRAADQHEHGRAERSRLLDGAAVVVVGAGRREEAAAAERGDPQAGVAQHARGRPA